jgi:hypothetical protein
MFIERRPPVLLDSDESLPPIRDHYMGRDPSHFLTRRIAHPLSARVFHSIYAFEGDAKETIVGHAADGGQLLEAPEHILWSDPFVEGEIVHREPGLKHMEGTSVLFAKGELFNIPVAGWALGAVGGKPVLRTKNMMKPQFKAQGSEEEIRNRVHMLGDIGVEIMIDAIDRGLNGLAFARNERLKKGEGPDISADKLRLGVGRIAAGVARPENLLIMPSYIDYSRGKRRPTVFFGFPIKATVTKDPEVMTK